MSSNKKIEIIDELFRDKKFDIWIKSSIRNNDKFDDFKQELFLIILGMDEDLIIGLYNRDELYRYTKRIINNQYNSMTSPYYYKYKKEKYDYHYSNSFYEIEDYHNNESVIDFLDTFELYEYINRNNILSWYEFNMLCIYYKMGNYNKVEGKMTYKRIEEEYGIGIMSSFNAVKKGIEKIKQYIKEDKTIDYILK